MTCAQAGANEEEVEKPTEQRAALAAPVEEKQKAPYVFEDVDTE